MVTFCDHFTQILYHYVVNLKLIYVNYISAKEKNGH